MKKKAYWHVYLTNDPGTWAGIAMEQLSLMQRNNLLDELDAFEITAIHYDAHQVAEFRGLVRSMVTNADIDFVRSGFEDDHEMVNNLYSPHAITENYTIQKFYKDCLAEDQYMLYFHTKGITADYRFLRGNDFTTYRNYYMWRQFLNWGVLDQWRSCVEILDDGDDIVGPNFQRDPVPHYSGAFYWTKSSHVRTLPDPSTTQWWKNLQSHTRDPWLSCCPERFKDELWICQAPYDYHAIDIANGHPNPASEYFPTSEYWK